MDKARYTFSFVLTYALLLWFSCASFPVAAQEDFEDLPSIEGEADDLDLDAIEQDLAQPPQPPSATIQAPTQEAQDTPVEQADPKIKEGLDLSDEVFIEIQQDPTSYLGNIRYEDIIVVQKRYSRLDGRFYITGFGAGGNFFSEFSKAWVHGAAVGYFFSDSFGWEFVHGLIANTVVTELSEIFLRDFNLNPIDFDFRIRALISSAIQWNYSYGKFAFHNYRVLRYDTYVLAGPAGAIYENTFGFGVVLGAGMRVYLNKWTSLGIEIREYLYSESTPQDLIDRGGVDETNLATQFFIFLNLTVYFSKFAFLDEV